MAETVFAEQQVNEFIYDLNSSKPMPGGGSAAALCGAMAAALTGMSAHMTVGKKKYAAVDAKMQGIIMLTEELQEEMMNFAQEDADMYSLVLDAYKLPKKTAEEAERRNLAIDDASRTAVYSSLKVTRACNRIMKLAYTVVTEGDRMLVTDGGASALLARACQRVAAYNVKINLGGVADPFFKARAQQELERQLADGKALEEEVLKEVDARL